MMRALWTAGSGMLTQQFNIDTISNNLANVNTIGFKKLRPEFEDLLYQTLREPGSYVHQQTQLPTGLQVGHGSRAVATTKIFTQGDFQQTENPLDLVIEGDGFFQIQMPDGTTNYTRSGAFKIDSEGSIVNSEGYYLQPRITVPQGIKSISVGADGIVSVMMPGENAAQQIGQLELATFVNPAGLSNKGQSLYVQTPASGEPIVGIPDTNGTGDVRSGFLEMSNVKVVEEMVNMIVAQRAYDVNSKAVQASDEMLQTANNLKR
ncbi:MAG TPA: flagellar basal-body rod protein FlgG [Firmicutes bacterium]|jgi:flagellar basal-body rod protein FlgG|nr:flagellar basal-body rod protein FlgG [Bacillota bacterium]